MTSRTIIAYRPPSFLLYSSLNRDFCACIDFLLFSFQNSFPMTDILSAVRHLTGMDDRTGVPAIGLSRCPGSPDRICLLSAA